MSYSAEKSPVDSPHLSPTYSINNIQIIGTAQQQHNIIRWLDEIAKTPKGRDILSLIIQSPHQLSIKHSIHARLSAGRTIAPMTQDLTNGIGASVKILFDATMPDSGTHRVFNHQMKWIEFSAPQNLFHELAHAAHKMNGTWRYFDSEGQAIEEENVFRRQIAKFNQQKPTQRYSISGELIAAQ